MQRRISLPTVRATHHAGTPHHEEIIPPRTGPPVTASLISLQRVIGNRRVLQLLRAGSPLTGLSTVSGRVQRSGYGEDESWGEVRATDGDYGGSQSSESGGGSSGGGYGSDEGWGDARTTDGGYGGSQSSEYGGGSSEGGYGYDSDEGWGDAETTKGGYGGPQSSEYDGGSSQGGYDYGSDVDSAVSGGAGGSSDYGGSSASGESGGEEGYGYGVGDDPLAAGEFESTEEW